MKGIHPRTLFYIVFKDLTQHLKLVVMVSIALTFSLLGFFVSSSLLSGFKQMLQDSVINVSGHIVVKPKSGDKYMSDAAVIMDAVKRQKHVFSAAGRITSPVQINAKKKGIAAGTLVMGVVEEEEKNLSNFSRKIISGRFLDKDASDEMVLGRFLADGLEGVSDDNKLLEVGSKVQLITSSGKQRDYEVVGIVDTDNIAANNVAFLNRSEVENLVSAKGKLSEIFLKLDSINSIAVVKSEIDELKLPVQVFSWDEQAKYIQEIIDTFSVVANLINAISLFAAAMVMFVVISINTERKRKEIATLRSLGTNPTFIIIFFVTEGIFYTFLGILIGSPIFYLIHRHFQTSPLELFIGDLRTVLSPELLTFSFALFFLITLLASIYPAWRTAKHTAIRILWQG